MRFRMTEWHDGGVVHEETGLLVGRVDRETIGGKPGFVFKNDEGHVVARTNSLTGGFRDFAVHEAVRPRHWERANPIEYQKLTHHYDVLSVRQAQDSKWLVFRDGGALVDEDGRPLRLATREQAQHIADRHMGDNREGDGLSWLESAVVPDDGVAPEGQSFAQRDPIDCDDDLFLVEGRLGYLIALAALIFLRAQIEQKQTGKIQPDSTDILSEVIVRLYGTWWHSRGGSYDSKRDCCEPYFAREDGTRMIFGEAARHYGQIVLRKHMPEMTDARIQELLSLSLEYFNEVLNGMRGEPDPWTELALHMAARELHHVLTPQIGSATLADTTPNGPAP